MKNIKGFSLIELLIVICITGVMLGAVTPIFVKQIHVKAAKKCAEEMQLIQNSALKYYVTNRAFPENVQVLKDAGLLNSTWDGKNPFRNDYSLSSSGLQFTVSTQLPQSIKSVVTAELPHSVENPSGASSFVVLSTVTAPGGIGLDRLIYRSNSEGGEDSTTMIDEIFVEEVESNTGTAYKSHYGDGTGEIKDIYIKNAGKWLSEMRPEVTEAEEVVIQIVSRHHPDPNPPPPVRRESYGKVSRTVSWVTVGHPVGEMWHAHTVWYLDGNKVAERTNWGSGNDYTYSFGAGCQGTRDSGRAIGDGCFDSFPVSSNEWGGSFFIGGVRGVASGSGSFEHVVEVWGHYYE